MVQDLIEKLDSYNLTDWGVIFHAWKGVPELEDRIKSAYISNLDFDKLSDEEDES